MEISKRVVKSIFVPSRLPDADFVANPYTGCQFGCLYCYAIFTCRFVAKPRNTWGNFVVIKENAVDLAKKQLARWPSSKKGATLLLSSVTDPYQGIEKDQQLTRGILSALVDAGYQGKVAVLTKSPLVLRDVDLLKQLNAEVGLTITTTDDKLSRFLEVRAPLASKRLSTLQGLTTAGIKTYAFLGPLLPHFRLEPEKLESLFEQIALSGTREIYAEQLNLPTQVRQRIWQEFSTAKPDLLQIYQKALSAEHRDFLSKLVRTYAQKYNLHLRLNDAIYHQDLKTH
jgi:DNA repair photolyase